MVRLDIDGPIQMGIGIGLFLLVSTFILLIILYLICKRPCIGTLENGGMVSSSAFPVVPRERVLARYDADFPPEFPGIYTIPRPRLNQNRPANRTVYPPPPPPPNYSEVIENSCEFPVLEVSSTEIPPPAYTEIIIIDNEKETTKF